MEFLPLQQHTNGNGLDIEGSDQGQGPSITETGRGRQWRARPIASGVRLVFKDEGDKQSLDVRRMFPGYPRCGGTSTTGLMTHGARPMTRATQTARLGLGLLSRFARCR